MLKRSLFTALMVAAAFAITASANAAYLSAGTTNTSNATTTLTGSTAGPELKILNANASNQGIVGANTGGGTGIGVFGSHPSSAGTGPAVQGSSGSRAANAYSIYGLLNSTTPGSNSAAVRGQSNGTNGNGYGVWGSAPGSAGLGAGVFGTSVNGNAVEGSGGITGVEGSTSYPNGQGVFGEDDNGAAAFGVWGKSSTGYGVVGEGAVYGGRFYGSTGVLGTGTDGLYGSGSSYGVYGYNGSSSDGVYGYSTSGKGVYGDTGTGWAGYFHGDVNITGTLTSGVKDFKIDDPLDPAHKYLLHTSVESSDMMDIYNGNVTTNAHGFATIRLPSWFQALNRTFRYQLTVIDKAHWTARAAVWSKIAHNRFTVRTDQAHVQVSWQVTGIRHDPYANAYRTQVVEPKSKADKGKYLHPELYGKPRSDGIGYQKAPTLTKRGAVAHAPRPLRLPGKP
jgi:hypothetical protein